MENDNELIKISDASIEVIEAQNRAEYDIQISTAKKFPRNLVRVKENCIALVTMNKETAESCRYSLPKQGKILSGPSVHLAKLIAQQYGNIRVDTRIKQVTERQVISEAVCFDLETNYACKVEVRRSIMQNEYVDGKESGRMVKINDDMITVTGNASNSIALRNAILNVVPKGLIDSTYKSAILTITGDLSDEKKLIEARNSMMLFFKEKYGINENMLLATMSLNSINQVKEEQIADLIGMKQSLKDGDSTVKEMFGQKKTGDEKKEDLKKAKTAGNSKPVDLP